MLHNEQQSQRNKKSLATDGTTFRLMPVSSVVVVAVAVDNVSKESILSSAIFHRTNVTAGFFYCILADHFFPCKEPAIKYY